MKKKIFYLWVLLLMIVGGVNGAWASEVYTVTSDGVYINTSTGTATFATSTNYQATSSISMYIGSGWNITGGEIVGTANATNSSGDYTYNNNALPTSGAYITFTPSTNGTFTFKGVKKSGGNKYLVVQSSGSAFVTNATFTWDNSEPPSGFCVWVSDDNHNGYKLQDNSQSGAKTFTMTFDVVSGTTYYILFDKFSDWSFTGFEFTARIPDSDFGFMYIYRNIHSGDTYEGNPLINHLNLPVTYESTNPNAATIDPNTGAITIKTVTGDILSTKIIAHFAGNETYGAKDVSYDLNVAPELVYTDISVANLRYQPGVHGISGNQLNRSVGGFDLTFGNNEGIKCNNTNNFYFRTNSSGAKGSMTIALDGNNNNGSNYIKKIVFTAWGTPSLSVNSVARTSGTLTQTGASEWTWTQYYDNVRDVTFTSQGENDESILISNIKVYTNSLPTFTKDTPVPGFNRSSDSKAVGETVNISDLDISTTPGSFLFNYDFNAGGTGLSHTPFTNNTTWPGTISGTASAGTATIAASFDGTSNPFFNTVASTTVYTLTVSSGAKNTFTWDFTRGISDVDQWLLLKDKSVSGAKWIQTSENGSTWKLNNSINNAAFTQDGSTELEYAFGLNLKSNGSSSTIMDNDDPRFGLKQNNKLVIPNLNVGDEVNISFYALKDRGITAPSNLGSMVNFGAVASDGDYTATGTVTAEGSVELNAINNIYFYSITVRSGNKARPSLSFANGSNVKLEIPVGETTTTYTNVLSSVPTGVGSVTYSVLLNNATIDKAGGTVTEKGTVEVTSAGVVTGIQTGTTIIRVTVSEGTYTCPYYCDYVITAEPSTGAADWEYTADSKEIDGENRPYQGTVTFTKSGSIDGGTQITDVPGITLTIGANRNDETWNVVSVGGSYAAYINKSASSRPANLTEGCFYRFQPIVNGYITLKVKATSGWRYLYEDGVGNNNEFSSSNTEIDGDWVITKPLIAGKRYDLCARTGGLYLYGFTFRPAFLTPDETAEQTTTFEAYSNTTNFPKLVHGDVGVRFSGNRSVVNLQSNGGVTLVGGGTAIVRGKVISGDNALTAYYTLNANVLSLTGTNPTNGSTIISLDNNVFQFLFDQDIALLDGTKFVVLKDATNITSGCTIALNTNSGEADYQKRLNVSGFGTLESGSTYTIRLLAGAVSKSGEASIENAEVIGTFIVESTEPPLTWIYPSTTSAVRIGTSIVLQTSAKIDEHYPTAGIFGSLTYEGVSDSDPDYPMEMKAIKSDKNLVFKPKKPLVPNKLYTLTVGANQVRLDGSKNMITKDKIFLFTTGTATGTAPSLDPSRRSTPYEGQGIDSNNDYMTYDGGTIEFFFNVDVELEPYTTINVTPVNGNEPTAHATSEVLNSSSVLITGDLKIDDSDKKRLYFDYNEDNLRYDLYYKLVIPANTVTGPGGLPNASDIVINFKMGSKPTSSWKTKGTAFTGYPYTWNFTNFGTRKSTINDLYNNTETNPSNNNSVGMDSRWQRDNDTKTEASFSNYWTNGMIYPQGEVASYNTGTEASQTNVEIAEMRGLRWSLSTRNSSGAKGRMQINKSSSGYKFQMAGGTHYLTIPNVPANKKLYIKASVNSNNEASRFNINSNNATFNKGYASSVDKTIGVRGVNGQVYEIDVTSNGKVENDVTFCLQDVTFEIIAVATEEKAISDVGYATNARTFPVDYTLDETLLGTGVTAYKITGVNGGSVVASPVTKVPATTATDQFNGVMLHGSERYWPLFTLDVNSTEETLTDNKLIGVVFGDDTGKLDQKTGSNYNYVLSNGGYTVKYETGQEIGKVVGEASGVGFYLLLKDGTILANSTYSKESPNDYTAYLQLGEQYVMHTEVGVSSARQFFSIDFGDETTDIKVIGSESSTKTSDGAYYSLQGVRLDNPGKGIYIRNGKMVVVK